MLKVKFNFLCSGNVLNNDILIKNIPSINNEKQILVLDRNTVINKDKIIKSDEIICNVCNESAKIEISDYKIKIFGCKNNHITEKMLLKDFNKTQEINISKIIWPFCKNNNKGNSYNNELYRCFTCKSNLCILCRQKHFLNHNVINYEFKNYICDEHGEFYHSYCYNCQKNMCISCENSHLTHATESFGIMIKDKNILQEESKNFKNKIKKIFDIINEIVDKLNKVSENLKIYYTIHKTIISNINKKFRNYENLSNINEFNINNAEEDLDKIIINENNIFNQTNKLLLMYHKLEDISIPNNEDSELKEKNKNNTKNTEEIIKDKKKMNSVEAINILKNMLIESIEKTPLISDLLDINEIKKDYKETSPYLIPISQLVIQYKSFKKTRKDGNSFYTCFIYRLFEYICIGQNKTLYDKIFNILKDSIKLIAKSWYDSETLNEFYLTFVGAFKNCFSKGVLSEEEGRKIMDEIFKNNEVYNYLNYFIRNCMAAYIKDNQLFFENFISQDFTEFLNKITEAGCEVGQIEILACVNYFEIWINIEYLFETKIESAKYPEDFNNNEIFINMLFRDNHYDLLYSE